ncbi:hypothetical protein, partial [Aeromonas veronii]|uniref:hypothetical protein n=1 Tax=Aeromonas veronii TaxID=654 RepID=UPI003004C03B
SVSHLVPSGSPFIGGKGVNHIQDGTPDSKKPFTTVKGFFISPRSRPPNHIRPSQLVDFS